MSDKDLMTQLQDLQAEYEKKAKKVGKPAFVELASPVFDAIPELDAIVWAQYAPSFNDGDACIFSVHGPAFHTFSQECETQGGDKMGGDPESEDYYELEVGSLSYWEGNLGPYGEIKVTAKQQKAMDNFSKFLNGALGEDIAQRVFGECAKVTITRDGKVRIDDCDHD